MVLKRNNLILELVLLFIGMPIILLIPIHPGIKAGIILVAVAYAIWVSIKQRLVTTKALYELRDKSYFKMVALRFLLLISLTVTFMLIMHPEDLFIVARKNLGMLIGISLFYSLFSVYPQEFLYRSFFYARYGDLFQSRVLLIFCNAVIFAFAHIAFKNGLVLLMTFIGGIVFSLTFFKTKSLMLTSIEHAIYGSWLFTVGMGEMLAFPMPQ